MPVIGIIQVGTQARADRYTYLPMIGVYLMVAWLLKEVADRWPRTRRPGGLAVVAADRRSARYFQPVSYWVDSYELFEHAVQVTDENYFAYNHIGIAYDSDAKKMTNGERRRPRGCSRTWPRISRVRRRTSTTLGRPWEEPLRRSRLPRSSTRRNGRSWSRISRPRP